MIERSVEISFEFDGKNYPAFDGETIAAALLRSNVLNIRNAPSGSPRGIFCVMGACQECVVEIDGIKVEACRTSVADGLIIKRAHDV
ncbi:MAG: (2Fe-2S)-binding protein [Kordiimonadaceae bacterium]|jgi:D-hydroxyproline dehydrogenase subunit gamma|nr:(2Fe-2S)-binding protein [Kordiimonadaceae bacterium]MBT6036531.1 (2Fe-2S)-binding protein [Kordiimonadaceae bacterium]MBT6328583.1 (2Fe-2S)-binding protein [Kordiimonadaceae bacterium]MBT7582365.1 (2Fe-2S)-binding protein [Kordiimonadaceae bacterium]